MREDHLKFLVCPACINSLKLINAKRNDSCLIESGILLCTECKSQYEIVRYVPRFVSQENYASGFGFQWNIHATTQYDNYSGGNPSEKRFFEETRWERDLRGQIVLEVGSGSGRFTEQAATTGAMIVSMDYSAAVDANYASNGKKDNVLIVQGDLYSMPFKRNFFDKLLCFGVLQHTPDVKKAFMELPLFLKKDGKIAIDVYRKENFFRHLFKTKYWVRPITRRMRPDKLYKYTTKYITFMWPLAKIIARLPYGRKINWALLIADYRNEFNFGEDMLKEWAILDTFDMLSPAYDQPQTIDTIKKWFREAQLSDVEVHYGYNGIEGRGTKPEKATDFKGDGI